MTDLNSDPRWRRFNNRADPCPCCGEILQGVFDIGYDHPDPWPHGNLGETGQDRMQVGEDRLTSDLCQIGPYRFIRCVLTVPIIGTDQTFSFGPWGSVNQDNFERYTAAWKTGNWTGFEGCFAWAMNRLPGVQMDDWLACDLIPGDAPEDRPRLYIHDGQPFADEQENGITFDRLLDIYAAAGHDMRRHLLDA